MFIVLNTNKQSIPVEHNMFRWGVVGNLRILKLMVAFMIGYESYRWDM